MMATIKMTMTTAPITITELITGTKFVLEMETVEATKEIRKKRILLEVLKFYNLSRN